MTTDDIRQAILDAITTSTVTEEAATTPEIAAAAGKPDLVIRAELRKLFAEGRLEVVRVPRLCLDGTTRRVPAYRVK